MMPQPEVSTDEAIKTNPQSPILKPTVNNKELEVGLTNMAAVDE